MNENRQAETKPDKMNIMLVGNADVLDYIYLPVLDGAQIL